MNLTSKNNGFEKRMKVGLLIIIIGGFLSYSALKIYILDPAVYAEKVMVLNLASETKMERIFNLSLATQNKESIIRIESNFDWVRKNQEVMQHQNSQIQGNINELLKVVKELKKQ